MNHTEEKKYKIEYQLRNTDEVFNTIEKHPRMRKFMRIAHSISCLSSYDKYRLGAIIILKGQIIARGYNKEKTHPNQKKHNSYRFKSADDSNHYIHAEIDALNQVKGMDLSKAEIIIYHTGPNSEKKMARPCSGCMFAIKERGIKKIHYSTPEGFATEHIYNKDVIDLNIRKFL